MTGNLARQIISNKRHRPTSLNSPYDINMNMKGNPSTEIWR